MQNLVILLVIYKKYPANIAPLGAIFAGSIISCIPLFYIEGF